MESEYESGKFNRPPLHHVSSADLDKLEAENEKLIRQLFEFTDQMDSRIEILRQREYKSEGLNVNSGMPTDIRGKHINIIML